MREKQGQASKQAVNKILHSHVIGHHQHRAIECLRLKLLNFLYEAGVCLGTALPKGPSMGCRQED